MKKFTKITSSIGPNSEKPEVLKKMIQSGVNVCRLNFSHDVGDAQGNKIDLIRQLSDELKKPVGVLCDLQGPKHRIGEFKTDEHYPLKHGQEFVLDNNPDKGDSTRVCLPDNDVLSSLKIGNRVLLNDGKIELEVIKTEENKVTTKVVRGTSIWARRGFNLPDTEIESSVLTPKDRIDLEYAITKEPDFVAISFVQRPEDVVEVREFISSRTDRAIKIVSKIERPQALERIEEIVKLSDAIMFARGDLAVEVPFEKLPELQRRIIRLCRKANKPVIIATQMLGSMVHEEFPLRAEISDVAIASYLRADSTMTSEETTVGENPVHVVETMAKILINADADGIENPYDWSKSENIPENDWSRSVVSMAYLNKAAAIVVFAKDTAITTQISCRRPEVPIVAVCNENIVANQLCLSRGVFPVCNDKLFDARDGFNSARLFGINTGKLVIVDDGKISLREIA